MSIPRFVQRCRLCATTVPHRSKLECVVAGGPAFNGSPGRGPIAVCPGIGSRSLLFHPPSAQAMRHHHHQTHGTAPIRHSFNIHAIFGRDASSEVPPRIPVDCLRENVMERHMASINLHVIIDHRSLTRPQQYDARRRANVTGMGSIERIEDGGNRHGAPTEGPDFIDNVRECGARTRPFGGEPSAPRRDSCHRCNRLCSRSRREYDHTARTITRPRGLDEVGAQRRSRSCRRQPKGRDAPTSRPTPRTTFGHRAARPLR